MTEHVVKEMQQGERITMVPVATIQKNPFQPRRRFDAARITELAESIKESGLAQPVLLRPDGDGGLIQVLGERRVRAYELLELPEIPSLIRDMTEQQARRITLIENLQREDLTVIEEAESFRDLVMDCDGNISEAARQIAKNSAHVTKRLKLLEFPQYVQQMIEDEKISLGCVDVLIELEPDKRVWGAELAIQHDLTPAQFRGMVQKHPWWFLLSK